MREGHDREWLQSLSDLVRKEPSFASGFFGVNTRLGVTHKDWNYLC